MLGMTWLLLTPNNVTISYTQNMLMQNDNAIEKEKAWGNGSGSIYLRERPYMQPCCRIITKGNWPVEERLSVKLLLEKGRE
jgi:hypothetical protein